MASSRHDGKQMSTQTTKNLDTLLQARYGQATDVLDALNPTIETLFQHKSVRGFTDQPLAPNTAELLVAAAQSASTSSNLQTWSVVAVEDQGRKDRLAAMAGNQKWISACPLFLVWVADLARLKALGDEHQHAYESLNYLEMLMMGTIDASLAAQNAAIAAESLDLGIVYIGGIRNKPLDVAKELGLPPMKLRHLWYVRGPSRSRHDCQKCRQATLTAKRRVAQRNLQPDGAQRSGGRIQRHDGEVLRRTVHEAARSMAHPVTASCPRTRGDGGTRPVGRRPEKTRF